MTTIKRPKTLHVTKKIHDSLRKEANKRTDSNGDGKRVTIEDVAEERLS